MTTSGSGPLDALIACRVIFVVRSDSREDAAAAVRHVLDAGGRAVELTATVPHAMQVLAALRPEAGSEGALLGMGTLLDVGQAEAALEAGADFMVSPGFDPAIVALARERGAAVLPGIATPTEAMSALSAGVDAVKLFPAMPAGPELLRALRGPFPDLRFVPSGGVRVSNAAEWFAAGAAAVGIGVTPATEMRDLRTLLELGQSAATLGG